MKIVVSGPPRYMNLGGPSIFHGVVKVLHRVFPGCTIVYHEPAPAPMREPQTDSDFQDIRVYSGVPRVKPFLAKAYQIKWRLGGKTSGTFEHHLLEEIRSANLYVDACGIDFCEKLSSKLSFRGMLANKPLIQAAHLFGVKAVHYTASYGPATGVWTRMAARAILGSRCSLVYCREEQSRKYLLEWGLPDVKLVVAPDTGLLMPSQPYSMEDRDPKRPLVGISVSHQIVRQWNSPTPYLGLIAKFCDRVVQRWGAQVVLIPNELWNNKYDDRAVAKDVLQFLENRAEVKIFTAENYSGPQQKGLIASCDMLLASRYHSMVAALSSGVPTIAIGWHHKYAELLAYFGQEDMYLRNEDCSLESTWQRCEDLWNRREEVRFHIRSRITNVENDIYQAGERMKDLFV